MVTPTMPQTIYLVGTCGAPNYGDELITAMWLRRLAVRFPNALVIVDCPTPSVAAVLMGDLHPNIRFVDTLWRLCWEAPAEDPWELATWVRHTINDPGRAPRWLPGIELLVSADLVHLVGGGYVNDNWPSHIGLLAGITEAARRSGARTALTGHGMFPTKSDLIPLLGLLVAPLDVVDVRDEASLDLLHRAGVQQARCSVDDAFLAIGPDLYRREETLPGTMLCVQSDLLAMGASALAGFVSQTLRSWQVDPADLGVVECIPRVDQRIYALLELDLPGVRFFPFHEVWAHGMPARAGQLWLSSRFHVHLVASAVGASGVAVAVNPDYYVTKHQSLIDLGSNWALSTGLDTPKPPTEGGFSQDVLSRSTAIKEAVAVSIYGPLRAPGRLARIARAASGQPRG